MTSTKDAKNGNRAGTADHVRAVCTVCMVSLLLGCGGQPDGEDAPLTYTVQPGSLTIDISESGTLRAQDQVIIKSRVPGRVSILSLIPEGTYVQPGDLLVKLDAKNLKDQKFEAEIRVRNAESAYIRAREELAITSSQATSDVARAELDLRFARQDLVKYTEGEYPQKLKEAEVRISLADEDLQRATEKATWSARLREEQYISEVERQADALAQRKAELELDLARGDLRLLTAYEHDRTLAELESDVAQTDMALERIRRKAQANIVQAEADLRAKEQEFSRQREKLAEIEDQIANTVITAPAAGQVVYASSVRRDSWRQDSQPLAEGQEVREMEELIYLPATSQMMAEVKIHETRIEKVSIGMPAVVTMDALPGRILAGRVHRVSPLPDPQNFWLNPDLKVFKTEVYIDGDGSDLRNGMSCKVEIIIERHENVLAVPIQCVVRVAGRPTVYVIPPGGGGAPEPRAIETGLDNARFVHVVSGLSAGEQVWMKPPLEDGEVKED
jgi:HlyD family secretion protein